MRTKNTNSSNLLGKVPEILRLTSMIGALILALIHLISCEGIKHHPEVDFRSFRDSLPDFFYRDHTKPQVLFMVVFLFKDAGPDGYKPGFGLTLPEKAPPLIPIHQIKKRLNVFHLRLFGIGMPLEIGAHPKHLPNSFGFHKSGFGYRRLHFFGRIVAGRFDLEDE